MQSNRFGNAKYISRFMQILIEFANNEDDKNNDFGNGDDNGNHMDEDNSDDNEHIVKKCGINSHFCHKMPHLKKICLHNK